MEQVGASVARQAAGSTPTASRLHLVAPAASCRSFMERLGFGWARELIAFVQETVGSDWLITGNESLIEATEDESVGGRSDDCERAVDLQRALGDDRVRALVALRGGAWLTRLLPRIDFSVLDSRTAPVAVIGFSELTTLVNIVGHHRNGLGIYDMGPAFLTYGLKRYAEIELGLKSMPEANEAEGAGQRRAITAPKSSEDYVRTELRPQVQAYFRDIISILNGLGTSRTISAELVRGELPDLFEATFVGGNLCVLTTMVGSPYRPAVDPAHRWLILEEINEKPERIDRFLAHLTLAGFWNRCQGLLLGDFHRHQRTLTNEVLTLLSNHLPPDRHLPILTTPHVGHVWPMSPLPLHTPVTLRRTGNRNYSLEMMNGPPGEGDH